MRGKRQEFARCYDCGRAVSFTGRDEYGSEHAKNATALRSAGWTRDYLGDWHCYDCKMNAKEKKVRP